MTEEQKAKYIKLLTSEDSGIRIMAMGEILENKINILFPNDFYEIYNLTIGSTCWGPTTPEQQSIVDRFGSAYSNTPLFIMNVIQDLNKEVMILRAELSMLQNSLRNIGLRNY